MKKGIYSLSFFIIDAYFDMEDGGYHSSGATNIRSIGAGDGLDVIKYDNRGVVRRHLYQ